MSWNRCDECGGDVDPVELVRYTDYELCQDCAEDQRAKWREQRRTRKAKKVGLVVGAITRVNIKLSGEPSRDFVCDRTLRSGTDYHPVHGAVLTVDAQSWMPEVKSFYERRLVDVDLCGASFFPGYAV